MRLGATNLLIAHPEELSDAAIARVFQMLETTQARPNRVSKVREKIWQGLTLLGDRLSDGQMTHVISIAHEFLFSVNGICISGLSALASSSPTRVRSIATKLCKSRDWNLRGRPLCYWGRFPIKLMNKRSQSLRCF